nr:hypothetical protein GCM10020092_096900 [Actinoplanes digitatis]
MLVALLLNHVRLAPGEAIWMPAGNLHAYLRGTGIEIMAASDNVLRGGLTPKRVDVEELLRVLRFEVLDDPILPATEVAPGVRTWQVPVREFALYRMTLTPTTPPLRLPGTGPPASSWAPEATCSWRRRSTGRRRRSCQEPRPTSRPKPAPPQW